MTIKVESRTGTLALVAALVTVLLWASAFVAIRYVGRELSAGALSLGRLIVAAVVLGAMMVADDRRAAVPRPWPGRRHWPRLLIVGVVWFGVYNVALNQAERLIDAGTAAMLVNVGPLLIAILAGLLLGEGFPRPLIAGSAIAFAGVVLIGTATSTTSTVSTWGAVLCLVAAVSYAVGVVAQKPLLADLSGLRVTWLACVIGAVVCLPYAPTLVRELAAAQPASVWWLVYLGVFPTAIGFTTWAYALARTSAGRLGATTYLVPAVAIVLAWALLGEVPPVLALAGGALCLVGVAISRRPAKPA
ncbi:DMT family transporter [Catellatospora sp. NPDC049609]|uniref:DMT family transporter n=1 Tax=Catellatospora sp. NPDC049609 TaxID=3155505 RepID=UPI003435942F